MVKEQKVKYVSPDSFDMVSDGDFNIYTEVCDTDVAVGFRERGFRGVASLVYDTRRDYSSQLERARSHVRSLLEYFNEPTVILAAMPDPVSRENSLLRDLEQDLGEYRFCFVDDRREGSGLVFAKKQLILGPIHAKVIGRDVDGGWVGDKFCQLDYLKTYDVNDQTS